jgi:hypothetical protein
VSVVVIVDVVEIGVADNIADVFWQCRESFPDDLSLTVNYFGESLAAAEFVVDLKIVHDCARFGFLRKVTIMTTAIVAVVVSAVGFEIMTEVVVVLKLPDSYDSVHLFEMFRSRDILHAVTAVVTVVVVGDWIQLVAAALDANGFVAVAEIY